MAENDIDRILKTSAKAELLEAMESALGKSDKAVVVLINDHAEGGYASTVMTLGVSSTYEAFGILDVGKSDLSEDDC